MDTLVRKVNARRYTSVVRGRAGADEKNLVKFYITYIHPVREYATPVWYPGLSTRISN